MTRSETSATAPGRVALPARDRAVVSGQRAAQQATQDILKACLEGSSVSKFCAAWLNGLGRFRP